MRVCGGVFGCALCVPASPWDSHGSKFAHFFALMIRRPVINSILNGVRTSQQILSGDNGFERAVGLRERAKSIPPEEEREALDLRLVSSNLVWALAFRRACNVFTSAREEDVEKHLAGMGDLKRLGETMSQMGVLRPKWLANIFQKWASRRYLEGVKQGVDEGFVVPGVHERCGRNGPPPGQDRRVQHRVVHA